MPSRYGTVFQRNKPGDPVSRICNTRNLNTAYSVLEDTEGVWCRIERDTDNGIGWRIVIDGGTDIDPGFPPPWAALSTSPWSVSLSADGSNYNMVPGVALYCNTGTKKNIVTQDVKWSSDHSYQTTRYFVVLERRTNGSYSVIRVLPANISDDLPSNVLARIPIAITEGKSIIQLSRGLISIFEGGGGGDPTTITGYDVAYDQTTGLFTKTPIYGFDTSGSQTRTPVSVYTAVDEEI